MESLPKPAADKQPGDLPLIDPLLAELMKETDRQKRAVLFRKFQAALAEIKARVAALVE